MNNASFSLLLRMASVLISIPLTLEPVVNIATKVNKQTNKKRKIVHAKSSAKM